MDSLQLRINNLKDVRNNIINSNSPNPKYIESLNWAIKVCQAEVSRKEAKKQLENRW